MRLFLLPISTRRTLLYCERIHQKAGTETTLADKITNKASTTWANWESAEPAAFWRGGWKKTLTVYGNAVLRRIPYEEWGLKSVPALTKKLEQKYAEKKEDVEVLFPGKYLKESKIQDIVRKLAIDRYPLHRQRLIWCCIGMPISAPFALVPVIPNIPFFYLAFRAYSHWKALSGAKHLQHVLAKSLLRCAPSSAMDQSYTAGLIHPSRQDSRDSTPPTEKQLNDTIQLIEDQTNTGNEDVMLLRKWNGKLLAERFQLPEMEVEIERAVEQVEKAIKEEKEAAQEREKQGAAKSPRSEIDEKKTE